MPEAIGVSDLDLMKHSLDFFCGHASVDEFKNKLMNGAAADSRSGKTICYIMRSLGCFGGVPDGFDYKQACTQMIAMFAPWMWDELENKIKCLAI